MVDERSIEVTVEIDGKELVAGTLWIHQRGKQSATFRYSDRYLNEPASYDLDPALPKVAGVFQTPGSKSIFNAFADSAPDRWGQNLMGREERERAKLTNSTPRTLRGADFLLGVRDDVRQGAIRFRKPDTRDYYSSHESAVPRLVDMSRLLRAVDQLDEGTPLDRNIKDLIEAGGSLGGARPKAAVLNNRGELAIAKFPRTGSDNWDVISWENVELRLAQRAGIQVSKSEMIQVGNRNALIVNRFDRRHGQRIGFISALTMLESSDGETRSYLEVADAIERHSPRLKADLEQLFCRLVFSILTGNTDDHLRNHGFLRRGRGWILSPAYDLNPNPDSPNQLSTAIDFDNLDASLELALSVVGHFRLSLDQAKSLIAKIERATREWRQEARSCGINEQQIDLMAIVFESEQRRFAQKLKVET